MSVPRLILADLALPAGARVLIDADDPARARALLDTVVGARPPSTGVPRPPATLSITHAFPDDPVEGRTPREAAALLAARRAVPDTFSRDTGFPTPFLDTALERLTPAERHCLRLHLSLIGPPAITVWDAPETVADEDALEVLAERMVDAKEVTLVAHVADPAQRTRWRATHLASVT